MSLSGFESPRTARRMPSGRMRATSALT